MDWNRLTNIWFVDVFDTDWSWITDVNRATMNFWVSCRDLSCLESLQWSHRPHWNIHVSFKDPSFLTLNIGLEHWAGLTKLHVSHWDVSIDESFFKWERATEHKGHQIICPKIGQVWNFLTFVIWPFFSIKHSVWVNVFSNVNVSMHVLAWIQHFYKRTRFRIPLAEHQKVEGVLLWKYYKVTLNVTWSLSSCVFNIDCSIINAFSYISRCLIELVWWVLTKLKQFDWACTRSIHELFWTGAFCLSFTDWSGWFLLDFKIQLLLMGNFLWCFLNGHF